MTAVLASPTLSPCLSEISLLVPLEIRTIGFRFPPAREQEDGRRLSFRLSRQFPHVAVIWHEGVFYAIAAERLPTSAEWQNAVNQIWQSLTGTTEQTGALQWVRKPVITPAILASLSKEILQVTRPFTSTLVYAEQSVEVRRQPDLNSEIIEFDHAEHPALALSVYSPILFQGTLETFFETHPYRHNPEQLLVGLKVEEIESGSTATIVELQGMIAEHRQTLLNRATGAVSRQALVEAPDEQPVIGVKFGKTNKTVYQYAMAALRPCITAETADQLGVEFGVVLRATKISYHDRQQLLQQYREEATQALMRYGINLKKPAICSTSHPNLFWYPTTPIEQTQLLFGKGVKQTSTNILNGLSSGGVYRHHRDYQRQNQSAQPKAISIAVLNLLPAESAVAVFLQSVQQRLKRYGFQTLLISEHPQQVEIGDPKSAIARAKLEAEIVQLVAVPPDIVFAFLPQSDRGADDDDSGSLYHRIYSRLLRRRIASQVIYEDSLQAVQIPYLLNQVIPGVLAKLGNLPYVLAEPLQVADCFVGLDVARAAKKRLSGSMNACAGVCLYGKQGEFIRARSEDAAIEGEEIPQRFLETLLPANELRGKTVLIYRDGRFCGEEVSNLLTWADAIDARFILVECRKSGAPRLYRLVQQSGTWSIAAPDRGLALRLSQREAILVTTKVSEKIGVARPLRITIRPEGYQVPIDDVLDATLKLTLLHHGALHPPRLPILLHGADRLSNLRLNGVYLAECDRQFWL